MQFNAYNVQQSSGGGTEKSEKLIARYVHSGNSVVNASSVDPATGIFTTTVPMSWTAGTIYSNIVVSYKDSIPTKLFSEWNGANTYGLKVIDANTFYIVNGSSGNSIVTYASGQTVDVTQLQFEYLLVDPPLIDLVGIDVGDVVKTTWSGIRNRPSWTLVKLNFTHDGGSASSYLNIADGRTFSIAYYEQHFNYARELNVLMYYGGKYIYRQWNGGTSWAFGSSIDPGREFRMYKNLQFTAIEISGGLSNNSIIEVYSII